MLVTLHGWFTICIEQDQPCDLNIEGEECCTIMLDFFYTYLHVKRKKKSKKRKKYDLNVATNVNYGFASFLSWSKSIYNPKTCTSR
jgi:hypothetical protein